RVQQLQTLLDHELTEKAMAEDQVNAVIERRHSSYESHQREIDLFVEACRSWMLSLVELQLTPPGDLLETLRDWCQGAEGPNPVRLTAEAALAEAMMRLSERISALESELSHELREIAELETEQRSLVDGIHTLPPVPYTRTPGVRDTRPGSPLWLLVDFIDHVPAQSRAGIEAALESAGFLDAWVMPDGRLIDARDDTILVAA